MDKSHQPLPYGKPEITEEDIAAVAEVMRSGMLTGGPQSGLFEQDFLQHIPAPYAVAVSNGTSALHLSVKALGLKPGEKVIVPTLTFAATANCVLYEGGEVVLADIDPATWIMDIRAVEALLKQDPGGYRGIIVVDFAGYPADMPAFRRLADEHGCWLLEDACHAPGAWAEGPDGQRYMCGDCRYADAAIFSFHPVKHITTGEGGMVTTKQAETAEKIRLLRNHGMERRPEMLTRNPGNWHYEIHEMGYNYRLSDMLAALGRSQLRRFEQNLLKRRELAEIYLNRLNLPGVQLPPVVEGHGWHLFVVRTDEKKALYDHLLAQQIIPQTHYMPLHMQPYFQQKGYQTGDFPHAEDYYYRCNSLPLFPQLTTGQLDRVVEQIEAFLKK
jgi:dTDP-4-amino-4,6-dideoxygalactose transaminase